MRYRILGTCSYCKGPVQEAVAPDLFQPVTFAQTALCLWCGSIPANPYGPVVAVEVKAGTPTIEDIHARNAADRDQWSERQRRIRGY